MRQPRAYQLPAFIAISVACTACARDTDPDPVTSARTQRAALTTTTPSHISAGTWRSIGRQILEDQLELDDRDGALLASSPHRRWRARFARDASTFTLEAAGEHAWRAELSLERWGRGEDLAPAPQVSASHHEATRLEHRRSHIITEWFENKGAGIEHGFTLASPPTQRGDERVVLELDVSGLAPRRDERGQHIALVDSLGATRLVYKDLVVWDARGDILDADLRADDDGHIEIAFDDTDAHYPITVDPTFVEQAKLEASNSGPMDEFSHALSLSGDVLIVGVPGNDNGAQDTGCAYIFSRDRGGPNTWGKVKKINALDGATGDLFGSSVAISGQVAVVGAPTDNGTGTAYVFGQNFSGPNGWGEITKLEPATLGAGDEFGASVSIAGDKLIVGAPKDDASASDAGAAYIFSRDNGGADNWGQLQKLTSPAPSSNDACGAAVDITTQAAIVGAPGADQPGKTDAGAAHLFAKDQGGQDNWGHIKELAATQSGGDDAFGASVTIDASTTIIGAPFHDAPDADAGAVFVFDEDEGGQGNWGQVKRITAPTPTAQDHFGQAVDFSGGLLAIGAPDADTGGSSSGAAYLFGQDVGGPNGWSHLTTTAASDAQAGDRYGASLALDGDTLIVGAPLEDTNQLDGGAIYVLQQDQGGQDNWGELLKTDALGSVALDDFSATIDVSGDLIAIGAYQNDDFGSNTGAVYLFERDTGGQNNWGQLTKLTASDPEPDSWFGNSVSLDGDWLAVGARQDNAPQSGAGAVYLFERNTGGQDRWGEFKKLTASDSATDDNFGYAVSLDDGHLLVGSFAADVGFMNTGAAYIFARDQGGLNNWGQVKKLSASDADEFDQFGSAVALRGSLAVVGAARNDDADRNSGSAYVFSKDEGGQDNWGEVKKLLASDAARGDQFGFAVEVGVDTVFIGAYADDDSGSSSGSVYLFRRDLGGQNNWGELRKLLASDGAAGDQFGYALSWSADTLAVGSYWDDDGGVDSGSVYTFARDAGGQDNWGESSKFRAADANPGAQFGFSLSIDTDTIAVGARYDLDGGSAYIFDYINRAPTGDPGSIGLLENTSASITLSGQDPDMDPLTFRVTQQPTNGMLSGAAPNLTYTPNTDFVGADSIEFVVNDGVVDSAPVTISINVGASNDAPVALDQDISVTRNTQTQIVLNATDADMDPLTFTILTPPTNGMLSGMAPNLTYTPNMSFIGFDRFTYKANDGSVDSNVAEVVITIRDGVIITEPAQGATFAVTSVTVRGTADAGSTIDVRVDGATAGFALATGAGEWSSTINMLAEGPHTVSAVATDLNGTTSTAGPYSFTIDTMAPTVTFTAPTDGQVIADARPTIEGTTEALADVSLTITTANSPDILAEASADAAGTWTVPLAQDLQDATYTIEATSTDLAQNTSTTVSATFTVDTTPPVTTLDAPAPGAILGDGLVTFSGASEPGAAVTVFVDGATVGVTNADDASAWSVSPADPLGDGEHLIRIASVDIAGNAGDDVDAMLVIDTTAPALRLDTPAPGSVLSALPVIASGAAERGARIEVFLDGESVGVTDAAADDSWSVELPLDITDGEHAVSATATDGVGNTADTGDITFTFETPTELSIVSPVDGATVTGPTLEVSGTGPAGAMLEVSAGADAINATIGEDNRWSVTFEGLPPGSLQVTATTADATATVTVVVAVDEPANNMMTGNNSDNSSTGNQDPNNQASNNMMTGNNSPTNNNTQNNQPAPPEMPTPTDPGDEGGCGCASAGSSPDPSGILWLLVLGGVRLVRRRRA